MLVIKYSIGDDEWSDYGHTLKVESRRFLERLDVECEGDESRTGLSS